MKFNLNHYVKVRLTDSGRYLHRKNFDMLYAGQNEKPKYTPPKEDSEGWSRWQLWHLMQEFGEYLSCGCNIPFETTIELEKEE